MRRFDEVLTAELFHRIVVNYVGDRIGKGRIRHERSKLHIAVG